MSDQSLLFDSKPSSRWDISNPTGALETRLLAGDLKGALDLLKALEKEQLIHVLLYSGFSLSETKSRKTYLISAQNNLFRLAKLAVPDMSYARCASDSGGIDFTASPVCQILRSRAFHE